MKDHWVWLTENKDRHFYKIGNHIAIFRPHVFPKAYELVLAPTMAALEIQYKRLRKHDRRPISDAPNMTDMQVACFLERMIVYGVTGDRRVLPVRLGEVLGAIPAITSGMMPCFSGVVSLSGLNAPSVAFADWPTINGDPVLITRPTVQHHYSAHQAEVSYFHFCRQVAIELLSTTPFLLLVNDHRETHFHTFPPLHKPSFQRSSECIFEAGF